MEATQSSREENLVSADEYFQLVLSNKKMDRIDTLETLGLLDVKTGTRYVIRRDHLHSSTASPAPTIKPKPSPDASID